ncbi:MAG: winged helix-turn-helix domain-containing protein [bacterium]
MFGSIGEIAGKIWNYLNTNGETTLVNLKKDLNLKTEQATLSLGWLAREGKIDFEKKGSAIKILLVK